MAKKPSETPVTTPAKEPLKAPAQAPTPVPTIDIANIRQLTEAVAKLATGLGNVFADGKVSIGDLQHMPAVLSALRGLAGVDFKSVLPELKDMNDLEREELGQVYRKEFSLSGNEGLEATIEQGHALLLMAVQAILSFVQIKKAMGNK